MNQGKLGKYPRSEGVDVFTFIIYTNYIDENYLLLFSLIKNALSDQSQPEELLFNVVKYLFKVSDQNKCILVEWVQPILETVLDQMNDQKLSRILIILNFALDLNFSKDKGCERLFLQH